MATRVSGKEQDVRPLAIGTTGEIAAVMGWSPPYTLGVLAGWKMAPGRAVLCYDQRITRGPAEIVDAAAKDLASQAASETCGTQGREESREARGL
jgi:hypothetical protein